MLGALLALVFIAIPDQRTWTVADTVLQGALVAVTAADYLQTRSFLREPDHHEKNNLLGRHPSMARLTLFTVGGLTAHTAIAYALPKPWRTLWQLTGIAIEGATVYGNIQVGVRIRW